MIAAMIRPAIALVPPMNSETRHTRIQGITVWIPITQTRDHAMLTADPDEEIGDAGYERNNAERGSQGSQPCEIRQSVSNESSVRLKDRGYRLWLFSIVFLIYTKVIDAIYKNWLYFLSLMYGMTRNRVIISVNVSKGITNFVWWRSKF